jgi:hypothetical protein
MGLDTYGFVISRSPAAALTPLRPSRVWARRVRPNLCCLGIYWDLIRQARTGPLDLRNPDRTLGVNDRRWPDEPEPGSPARLGGLKIPRISASGWRADVAEFRRPSDLCGEQSAGAVKYRGLHYCHPLLGRTRPQSGCATVPSSIRPSFDPAFRN